LRYLEQAVHFGLLWGQHDFIEIHPVFDYLHNDEEFIALVERAQDDVASLRAQVIESEKQNKLE
jgi:hypothetical protein